MAPSHAKVGRTETVPETEQEDTPARRQLAPRPQSARLHAGEFGPDKKTRKYMGCYRLSRLRPLVEDVPVGQPGGEPCLYWSVKQNWQPMTERLSPRSMSATSHRTTYTMASDNCLAPAPWLETATTGPHFPWFPGNGQI